MSLKIKSLKAYQGDSILISFSDKDNGTTRNILIDGGPEITYSKEPKTLKNEIGQIKEKNENIDLLVITHIDDDHIGGILSMFEDKDNNKDFIKEVWFNSGGLISSHFGSDIGAKRDCRLTLNGNKYLSAQQGVSLENSLKKLNCWEQQVIFSGSNPVIFYGSIIRILSPNEEGLKELNDKWEKECKDTFLSGKSRDYKYSISELIERPFKEDSSVPNRSSISFLFEYRGKKILMLGDSLPSVVTKTIKSMGYSSMKKLEIDLVKVSHHGSRKNISPELLDLIKCTKYLICTDGSQYGLPDKESMARIIASNDDKTCIYFNYDIYGDIFTEEDHKKFDFELKYLDKEVIEL
jgi:beta-lactamase superfamily II metal-dependent hydrolase